MTLLSPSMSVPTLMDSGNEKEQNKSERNEAMSQNVRSTVIDSSGVEFLRNPAK